LLWRPAAAAIAVSPAALGQDGYPERPIRFIATTLIPVGNFYTLERLGALLVCNYLI